MTYFDELEAALVAASARHQPRARKRFYAPMGAAAALLLVLGLVALTVARTSPASASSIAISNQGGWTQVRLEVFDAPPETVVRDLRDAGFEVKRFSATTGPSEVGRVLTIGTVGDAAGRALPEEVGFEVPEGWKGTIQLVQGVPAPSGARYMHPTDAFEEGEPLACLASGARAADVVAVAQRLRLSVTWAGDGRAPDGDVAVVGAVAHSPTLVTLVPDPTKRGRAVRCD
jgi:hypothetical protein